MIEPERQKSALAALHHVLVLAREVAQSGGSSSDLACILDWAEILPTHIAAPIDQTKDFRMALDALADRFPQFRAAIAIFDNPAGIEASYRRRAAAAARTLEASAH